MSSEIIASHAHLVNPSASSLFTRGALVGRGAYGGVYKATHNSTGLVIALKVVDLDGSDDISEVQREVALLSEMRDAARHNITMYHGCYLNGHELWIAMDFASGGSIRTLVRWREGTSQEDRVLTLPRSPCLDEVGLD
jgi:serine/threonine protein kinase